MGFYRRSRTNEIMKPSTPTTVTSTYGVVGTAVTTTLLGKSLNTRLQRKAKSIIQTCIQFTLTDALILLQLSDLNDLYSLLDPEKVTGISWELMAITGLSISYVILLALFLLIHACMLPNDRWTTKEVEEAYARTNAIPVIDGLLELPFPYRFKGPGWSFAWVVWAVFIIFIMAIIVLYLFVRDEVQSGTILAFMIALLQVYQITSDFSEYWVYTRNPQTLDGSDDIENPDDDKAEVAVVY